MAHGQSRLYAGGDVAEQGDVTVASAVSRDRELLCDGDAMQEIDTLRSINAHLVRQIAVLKQREAQAQRLADRDGLTGLYNQRRMIELLDAAIAEAVRQDQLVGLLFIDLDGFKSVNDALGHAVGDKLLVTVAARIAARARTADFVCRYGGDEFVVILPGVADMAAVNQVADSIRDRVALPYRIDGIELHVTAAIGVSLYPDEACSGTALLHRADVCMYRAKAQGSNPSDSSRRSAIPARRREDKSNRRVAD